ncbi:hypothetical protein HN011_003037 [Eciton burchellii]|nr:hypothetical protein HN011_003037 [Eciton burchellii]
MVFLSSSLLVRSRGPDEFWRKRQIFKLAAHFVGRRRNCYSLAIRGVHRALAFSTIGRQLKKLDMKELREQRIDAATNEHGFNFQTLKETLIRCNIFLNRKVLADLSIWEPRSFKAITDIACARGKQDHLRTISHLKVPESIIVKGLIK